jgi:CsoR family transcriptional regulator, copper-sensing transcriptional repressor
MLMACSPFGMGGAAAAIALVVHDGFLTPSPRQHPTAHMLDMYTIGGYGTSMRTDIKRNCRDRLNRIEGQVRGIGRMIEEDRYCIDILTQIRAVCAALRGVEYGVLKDHVEHCVEGAIASGDGDEQRRKVQELLTVLTQRDR